MLLVGRGEVKGHKHFVNKLAFPISRYAVTIFSSGTISFFMQLHLPNFSWDSSQYAFAVFTLWNDYLFSCSSGGFQNFLLMINYWEEGKEQCYSA